MSAAELKAHYAAELQEPIIVRRYTGAGANRPKFDAAARGRAWNESAEALVGTAQEFNQRVIILVDDLIARGFALPVTTADKLLVKGREIAIVNPRPRKAQDGTLVAYDIQAKG